MLLAIRDYSDPDSTTKYNQVLDTFDLVFTGIYTAEALMKILSIGLIMHKKAYLRDPWNVFDILILILSWISIIP